MAGNEAYFYNMLSLVLFYTAISTIFSIAAMLLGTY